jgi:hypothetical protein
LPFARQGTEAGQNSRSGQRLAFLLSTCGDRAGTPSSGAAIKRKEKAQAIIFRPVLEMDCARKPALECSNLKEDSALPEPRILSSFAVAAQPDLGTKRSGNRVVKCPPGRRKRRWKRGEKRTLIFFWTALLLFTGRSKKTRGMAAEREPWQQQNGPVFSDRRPALRASRQYILKHFPARYPFLADAINRINAASFSAPYKGLNLLQAGRILDRRPRNRFACTHGINPRK